MGVGYHVEPFERVSAAWVAGKECAKVASFEAPFDRVYSSVERDYSERVQACEERPRLSFVTDASAQQQSGRITGRERWARLNEALNGFGLVRSKNQRWYASIASAATVSIAMLTWCDVDCTVQVSPPHVNGHYPQVVQG